VVTPLVTVFSIAATRCGKVAKQLLGSAHGQVVTSDRWKAYSRFRRRQLCWAHLRDAFLVKLGNDAGSLGDASKETIQLGHDHDGLGLFGGHQESASGRAAGEGLAATDPRILEDFDETESLQVAVGGNALALGFETQAAIGLFLTENTDVADDVFHGVCPCHFTPGRGQKLPDT
jgi:hypothetical protein